MLSPHLVYDEALVSVSLESLELYLLVYNTHHTRVHTKCECVIPHTRVRARWPQQANFRWMFGNTRPNHLNVCPYLLVAMKTVTFFILKSIQKLSSLNRDTKESYHSATVTLSQSNGDIPFFLSILFFFHKFNEIL